MIGTLHIGLDPRINITVGCYANTGLNFRAPVGIAPVRRMSGRAVTRPNLMARTAIIAIEIIIAKRLRLPRPYALDDFDAVKQRVHFGILHTVLDGGFRVFEIINAGDMKQRIAPVHNR